MDSYRGQKKPEPRTDGSPVGAEFHSPSGISVSLALDPIGVIPLGNFMKFTHPSIPYRFGFEH